jgi:hypothetical protein
VIHIYRQLFGRADLPTMIRGQRRPALSHAYLWAARCVLGTQDRFKFWRYLWRGLLYDPLSWRAGYAGAAMDAVLGERMTRRVQAGWHAWQVRLGRPCAGLLEECGAGERRV